ncbi:MAG: saccharopine dehydrogenase family protein, partial [Micrococcales bacterium]
RRSFFELMVVADYDPARADKTIAWIRNRHGEEVASKFIPEKLDASSAANVTELARQYDITHVVNAVEPKFVTPIFSGAFTAGANYIDMAMSLSEPDEKDPFHVPGIKLGDAQFAVNDQWEKAGKLALVGIGVEPGLSNIFARYASDNLFSEIEEVGVRDGANLVVTDDAGNEIFAPSFSIWTTIEECLNPPVIYEAKKGWFTTQPFSEPEIFEFPEGIGSVECVNVEHEEVLMIPRHIKANRVTFKYGLGRDFIEILKTLNKLGLDRTKPTRVRSAQGPVDVAPRDMVAAVLPNPAAIGPRMTGKTCAGVLVTGKDKDGRDRATYLYHVMDNQDSMAEYDAQCVVLQTAFNPVVALELLAEGIWQGAGVVGPEAFEAKPFLDLLASDAGYKQPWVAEERLPASPQRKP